MPSRPASVLQTARLIAVLTAPGATALTRTRDGASSCARVRISMRTPPLEAA